MQTPTHHLRRLCLIALVWVTLQVVTAVAGQLKVSFFDVGQADATLLQGPDFTVLIDAGDYKRNEVVPLLQRSGVTGIDLLIGTHPHADHIGQFPQILETFTVGEVWMSGAEHTSRTFERALDAILNSDAGYHEPRAGESFRYGSLKIDVLSPTDTGGSFNDTSVSIRALYGNLAMVFTGDAETESEAAMVRRGHDLKAQVLQVGHHGSRTSTTAPFLQAVNPRIAVYSAGRDNSYGHPHPEVIHRLVNAGVEVYGTDIHGTVILVSDGNSIEIRTERREPPVRALIQQPEDPRQVDAPARININRASLQDLQRIAHIGEARARQIMALRPFRTMDDLTQVRGIGPARLADIKQEGLAYVE